MIDISKILEHRNRGILLDVAVFLFQLILMRTLVRLFISLDSQAEKDIPAEIALGLFFVGVFILQPLGPILKRWSFHQRHKEFTLDQPGSFAGCLLFWYMFPYIIIMMVISLLASLKFLEVFGESNFAGISALVLGAGIVLSFVNAVIIFRYFLTPRKPPHWKFLTTPKAEWLGDTCLFLNVICFQVLWGTFTASGIFWESLNPTSHGVRPGLVGLLFFRFLVVGAAALLIYFPPRIFYLVIDRRRKITWLTMLLANLPLIIGIVLFSPGTRGSQPANAATSASPTKQIVLGKSSFVVTAEDFYREYELDTGARAKNYAGKYVAVTGRVQSVNLTKGGPLGSDVRLAGGGRVRWVICRFDADQNEKMQTLQTNQMVTLLGIGEKYWLGGPSLQHCVLVNAQ